MMSYPLLFLLSSDPHSPLINAFFLFLTDRLMGAGLGLSPEDLGGGGENQRRKKRLSSQGFERLSSTQVSPCPSPANVNILFFFCI